MSPRPPKTDLIRRHLEFLRFYPQSVEGHYNLGLAYIQAGQPDDALNAFQRAVELRPALVEAYINMGGIFFRQGKLAECVRANQKALEISPDAVQALNNLAFAYVQMKEWERVIETCGQVLELNPSSALAHHHLAISLYHQGAHAEALGSLRKASELGFTPDPAFREELEASAQGLRPKAGRTKRKAPKKK